MQPTSRSLDRQALPALERRLKDQNLAIGRVIEPVDVVIVEQLGASGQATIIGAPDVIYDADEQKALSETERETKAASKAKASEGKK